MHHSHLKVKCHHKPHPRAISWQLPVKKGMQEDLSLAAVVIRCNATQVDKRHSLLESSLVDVPFSSQVLSTNLVLS